jgi:hypothetical protein
MAHNVFKIKLSESQRLWLRAICSKLRGGEQVSARTLKVELRDKLPKDFDPSQIDYRLLAGEDQITLLGIALLDPTSELVKKADLVINSVQNSLIPSPEIKSIGVDAVSQEIKLPREEVAVLFRKLTRVGYFHDSGTIYGHGIDGLLTINIDSRTLDSYLRFNSLEGILDTLIDDESSPVNRATEERVQFILQVIRNLLGGLTSIWVKAIDGQDLNGAIEDLQRWKVQATKFLRDNISEVEARELQKITQKFPLIRNAGDLDFRISKYEERLKGLAKEIQDDPTLLPLTAEAASRETSKEGDSGKKTTGKEDLTLANQLYEKVKSLIQNSAALDETKARIIVESADDAIKEFGNTNQEKKVELREWKKRAELVLPPCTIEELRKRGEGQVIRKVFPSPGVSQSIFLWAVGIGVIATILFGLISLVLHRESKQQVRQEPPAPINSNSSNSDAGTEVSRPSNTKLVYLMDAADGDDVYDRKTFDAHGTNANDIGPVLSGLAEIRTALLTDVPNDPRQTEVINADPDLVITHLGSFYGTTAEQESKLDQFLRKMAGKKSKFLIYTRHQFTDDAMKSNWIAQREQVDSSLKGRIHLFSLSDFQEKTFRNTDVSNRFRAEVKTIIGVK